MNEHEHIHRRFVQPLPAVPLHCMALSAAHLPALYGVQGVHHRHPDDATRGPAGQFMPEGWHLADNEGRLLVRGEVGPGYVQPAPLSPGLGYIRTPVD